MNKIVLRIGLLVFFLSVIFFSQRGLQVWEVLLKSFVVFVIVTIMVGVFAIAFMRAIKKNEDEKKAEEMNEEQNEEIKNFPEEISRK